MEQIGITQIKNEITYRKIEELTICKVEIKDSKYHISLKYKLETRTREESIKTIIRTDEHIVWLLQSFEAERKLIIVPKFKSKSYLSSLAELITVSGDIRELQRTSEKIFMERMVTRLLNILVQVCLVLLNDYSVESTRPLFLFINERFQLYLSPMFCKQLPQSPPPIRSYLNKMVMKLRQFTERQTKEKEQISLFRYEPLRVHNQWIRVQEQLNQYLNSLQRIKHECIQEIAKISNKINHLKAISIKFDSLLNQLNLIVEQVDEIAERVNTTELDRSHIEEQFALYRSFVDNQLVMLRQQARQLSQTYFKLLEEKCEIRLKLN